MSISALKSNLIHFWSGDIFLHSIFVVDDKGLLKSWLLRSC